MGVSINGRLIKAIFKNRVNRFLAEVWVDKELQYAHVPNTGRMKEFLVEGAEVIVRRVEPVNNRKTIYDLLMVYYNGFLINIDSKLPNLLLEDAFNKGEILPFAEYTNIFKEVKYGNSRFDLSLSKGKDMAFVEAKCVTYAESNTASFPDAPTERGRKHVLELIEAVKEGMRGAVFFIIQREDACSFTPNYDRDPLFSKAVYEASKTGVEFYAISCKITPSDIALHKFLPISLD